MLNDPNVVVPLAMLAAFLIAVFAVRWHVRATVALNIAIAFAGLLATTAGIGLPGIDTRVLAVVVLISFGVGTSVGWLLRKQPGASSRSR